MTRYEAIEQRIARNKKWASRFGPDSPIVVNEINPITELLEYCLAALALPEDSKTVNAELYGLAIGWADHEAILTIHGMCKIGNCGWRITSPCANEYVHKVNSALRYLELREASGEPMPYKVIREGDKVRFE